MIKSFRVIVLGWLWISTLLATAHPLDTWYWRNPLPQGSPLYGACYGGGLYVAVGGAGAIMISPDGRNWLPQDSGTELDLRDVCFGDGRFVAVGDFGIALTSPDGRQWTVQDTGWFSHLSAVTWGKGKYVAVGEETTILVSTNGENWTLEGMGSTPLFGVIFGNDRFVAVGGSLGPPTWSNSGTNLILTSADANWWERHQIPGGSCLVTVGYGQSNFIAGAYDGPNGRSRLFYSPDGADWTLATLPQYYDYYPITSICTTSNAVFAFYGGVTLGARGSIGYCLKSDSGKDWVAEPLPEISFVEDAAASASTVVAVGTAYIQATTLWFRNTSGTWENVTHGRDIYPGTITWLGGKFLGLYNGEGPAQGQWSTYTALSTNGVDWSSVLISTNARFYALGYGNNRYVAVGIEGSVATSPDAETWTMQNPGINKHLIGIAGGNGVWVAATEESTVICSTNGVTWTTRELSESSKLYEITFGNGIFVVTDGGNGTHWISSDGYTWEEHRLPGYHWITTRFWEDRFIARNGNGGYFVSTNGFD